MKDDLKKKLITRISAVKSNAELQQLLRNAEDMYGSLDDEEIQQAVRVAQGRFGAEAAAARMTAWKPATSDPFERAVYSALAQYEELRSMREHRTYRATRIKGMYERQGLVDATRAVIQNKESDGFRFLTQHKRLDLTSEYLAVQFENKFDPETIALAKQRLAAAGIVK